MPEKINAVQLNRCVPKEKSPNKPSDSDFGSLVSNVFGNADIVRCTLYLKLANHVSGLKLQQTCT